MIEISTHLNDYRLQGVVAFLALGIEPARGLIYAGARPAFGEAPHGPLLASIALATPLGTIAGGVLELASTGEALILVTGNATWVRILNGHGALAWDCDVSDEEGSGELRLPSTQLYAGGYTRIVSGQLGRSRVTPVDLRFAHPPGGANLVLDGGFDGSQPVADARLTGTLPALTFFARAIPSASATLAATLPALACSATAEYRSRAARPVVGSLTSRWRHATGVTAGAQDGVASTVPHPVGAHAPWQAARAHVVGVAARRTATLRRAPVAATVRFGASVPVSPGTVRLPHDDAVRLRTAHAATYSDALRLDALVAHLLHQEGIRDRRRTITSRFERALPQTGRLFHEAIQTAAALHRGWRMHWQNAMRPPPGRRATAPGPDDDPPPFDPCYTPNPHLLFAARAATNSHLVFFCENHPAPGSGDGPVIVPIRRVYVVLNHVTLHRLPDGAPVPVLSLSLALDAASWTWGFEATLPASAEALVVPVDGTPVELVAHVNGTDVRVLAENLSRERRFGEASLHLSGRGRNAVLAAPYAPVLSFANAQPRTARQLMDDVLTVNGVPLGWDVDWGLTDWKVPAGVFAQQGTWIEAVAAIAEAAGGYLLPHPTDAVLRVRHRYPVAPWDWPALTPDLVLPVDAVSRESVRWLEKPAYNRVFVSGQSSGVLGQVTRTGTAGNLLAPMVVDALITEAAAARQRGIAVLADTGHQFEVGLRLPVLPETGIVEPGTFVEYQDGSIARIGLVRSTRVEAGWPDVWQTLGVECHA